MRIFIFFISFLILFGSSSLASFYYKVKRGDTLEKIAKRFKTTVTELKRVNKLSSSRIYVGQKLLIPTHSKNSSKRPLTTYRVKRGDSLSKIAKKFNTTVKELKRLNHLKGNRIYVGQRLLVPKPPSRLKAPSSARLKTSSSKSKSSPLFVPSGLTKVPVYKYYRVRKGDSVLKIAKKFRVSPRVIIRENHLRRPYLLRVGQRLKILVGYKDVLKLNRPISFRFPLDGRVDPTIREDGYPGIFILGRVGAPVKAAETGIVKFAGRKPNMLKAYGNFIIIQHPQGYQTIYANLDKIFVKENQVVKRGQIIGTAGVSGIWGRSGLYFNITKVYNGKTYNINPLEVLK